jgi:hypothetical protein
LVVAAALAAPAMAFDGTFESLTPGPVFVTPELYATAYSTTYSDGTPTPDGWGYGQNYGTSNFIRNANRIYTPQISTDPVTGMSGNKLKLFASPVENTTVLHPEGGAANGTWLRQVTSPGLDIVNGTRISFLVQMKSNNNAAGNEFFVSLDGASTFGNYIFAKAGAAATDPGKIGLGGAGFTEQVFGLTWEYDRTYAFDYEVLPDGIRTLSVDGVLLLTATGGTSVPTTLQMRSQKTLTYVDNLVLASVPEPASLATVGAGAIAVLARRRRR